MKPEQIEFIKYLDSKFESGTLKSVLFRNDLATCPFEATLKFLLEVTLGEKQVYAEENKRMADALKKLGAYTAENVLGEQSV